MMFGGFGLGGEQFDDPVVIATLAGSVWWCAMAWRAAYRSVSLPSKRRTVWPLYLFPNAALAGWWVWLNVHRWLSPNFGEQEYRAATRPMIWALLTLWGFILYQIAERMVETASKEDVEVLRFRRTRRFPVPPGMEDEDE